MCFLWGSCLSKFMWDIRLFLHSLMCQVQVIVCPIGYLSDGVVMAKIVAELVAKLHCCIAC